MTRINTNVSSINAQKSLARTNNQLQQALTRLSTGLRINVGKDDPAGLIASEILRSDIISSQRAVTNSERANQIIATADSALGQVSGLLNDIRALVTEAANEGAMSADQIAANQLQVDSSLEAINRIAQTTSFQGRRLLDGSLDFVTDSGAVASIEDLQIDSANLGATGAIAVDVDISAAATQATVTSASGDAVASTTLNFAAGLALTMGGGANDAVIDINAAALGPNESGVTVVFQDAATTGAAPTAVYSDANDTLTITYGVGNTVANVVAQITALDEFTASWQSGALAAGDTFGASVAADQLAGQTTGIDSLAITAVTAGDAFNDVEASVVTQVGLGGPTATYFADTKRLVITIDSATETTLAAINTAVTGLAEFTSVATGGGTTRIEGSGNPDPLATANTGITGYLNSGFSASTNATATLSFLAGTALSVITNTGATSVIDINATALGTAESNVVVSFVDDVAALAETAVYDSQAKTLVLHYSATASTMTNMVAAIDGLSEFSAVLQTGTGGATMSAATQQSGGGSSERTGVDSLAITAQVAGADFNNLAISVTTGAAITTPTAVYDSTANTLVITIDDDTALNLTAIDTAIDGLKGFRSVMTASGTGRVIGSGADSNAIANTETSGGNLLLDDLVATIGGTNGTEVFNFEQNASVNQIVAAINLTSDATGVAATQSNGLLTLKSTAYGSNALAFVDVISEGASGQFEDALSARRVNGTDIVGTINGITASGDGNEMSINTSTLDMSVTVTAGSSTNFEFNITGGGALFQLGPDVVSNQQARLGIQSLSTAALRGTSGRLYQLGTGQTADLDTDTTTAAAIVDQVITKVTSLRGRLGAFQKTTLDTNIRSLNDTLENLIAAESSIRDADFAAETAALTRAQILVQSGVSVLAIANSNPQNVLALLR